VTFELLRSFRPIPEKATPVDVAVLESLGRYRDIPSESLDAGATLDWERGLAVLRNSLYGIRQSHPVLCIFLEIP
jgi:hypothetical protein